MAKGEGDSDYISFDNEGGKAKMGGFAQRAAAFNPFRRSPDESTESPPSYFEAVHGAESVMAASKEVRMGFLRKVYGTLSLQLALTALICTVAMKDSYEAAVPGWLFISLARSKAFFSLVFQLSSIFFPKHSYPLNVTLLGTWTFAMSFTVATACAMAVCDPLVTTADPDSVMPLSLSAGGNLALAGGKLQCATGTMYADAGGNAVILAAGMTAGLFIALSVYTLQSKIDFSFLGAGLFASLWILIIFAICMGFFGASAQMQYWYALIASVVFSLYIVFDTWLIANKMGPDDYIAATINLYLDIINLFLMLLQLVRRD